MVDPARLREALREMRSLIESDPEVLARFDTDGNGVIDGFEWDHVRQLVGARLEREAAETQELSALAAGGAVAEQGPTGSSLPPEEGPGSVVREIFDCDLRAGASEEPVVQLSACNDLVLEQEGLGALVDSSFVRRSYAIKDAAGRPLGAIQQVENEGMQNLTRSVFELPELHFQVLDRTAGQTFTFKRSGEQLFVLDEVGAQQGFVSWKPGLLTKSFKVISSLDRGMLHVKSAVWRPFSLQILGTIGSEIGTIERGWSGLGAFLGTGNRMRIRVEPGTVSPNQRWGLVATALLAGIDDERR